MEPSILIISAIIIVICVIPVILSITKQKKKNQYFKNTLSEIAKTNAFEIKSYELSTPIAVGLTENDEAFVYYHLHENGYEEKACILLSEIKQCILTKINGESGFGNIGKLLLTFERYDKIKPSITLNLFDTADTFLLRGELQFAEKWKPLIDAAIVGAKSISHEAIKTSKMKTQVGIVKMA